MSKIFIYLFRLLFHRFLNSLKSAVLIVSLVLLLCGVIIRSSSLYRPWFSCWYHIKYADVQNFQSLQRNIVVREIRIFFNFLIWVVRLWNKMHFYKCKMISIWSGAISTKRVAKCRATSRHFSDIDWEIISVSGRNLGQNRSKIGFHHFIKYFFIWVHHKLGFEQNFMANIVWEELLKD